MSFIYSLKVFDSMGEEYFNIVNDVVNIEKL